VSVAEILLLFVFGETNFQNIPTIIQGNHLQTGQHQIVDTVTALWWLPPLSCRSVLNSLAKFAIPDSGGA
jgi:hypothetical protein